MTFSTWKNLEQPSYILVQYLCVCNLLWPISFKKWERYMDSTESFYNGFQLFAGWESRQLRLLGRFWWSESPSSSNGEWSLLPVAQDAPTWWKNNIYIHIYVSIKITPSGSLQCNEGTFEGQLSCLRQPCALEFLERWVGCVASNMTQLYIWHCYHRNLSLPRQKKPTISLLGMWKCLDLEYRPNYIAPLLVPPFRLHPLIASSPICSC